MENIPSHSWLEIDVQSLKHNWETVKSIARHRSRIMAVVKATCYGHGTEVAELLATFGLEDFGVTSAEEGCELKKRGLRGNIYILGGFLPWEAEVLVEEGFIPIVSSLRDIEYLEKASRVKDKRVYFHLKIDTGMGRLGLLWENSNVRFMERI
ncbi:MAG: alanine racemase, partial [Candidatus Caldatribacteriaceae bacterium]